MSKGNTPGIRVVATFQVTDPAQLVEAAKPCMDATRKEKGCIRYELHQVRK